MRNLLTILIPTRNRAKLLEQCISSLYNQNIKIIVSDNNSSDSTPRLSVNYPSIKYYRSSIDLSWDSSQRKLFRLALDHPSEYYWLIGDDDYVDPFSVDYVSEFLKSIGSNLPLAIAVSYRFYDPSTQKVSQGKSFKYANIASIGDFFSKVEQNMAIGNTIFQSKCLQYLGLVQPPETAHLYSLMISKAFISESRRNASPHVILLDRSIVNLGKSSHRVSLQRALCYTFYSPQYFQQLALFNEAAAYASGRLDKLLKDHRFFIALVYVIASFKVSEIDKCISFCKIDAFLLKSIRYRLALLAIIKSNLLKARILSIVSHIAIK